MVVTAVLTIHSRKMNLTRGIDLRKIAKSMHEASGAETKAVCTEAGMFALRERRVHVTQVRARPTEPLQCRRVRSAQVRRSQGCLLTGPLLVCPAVRSRPAG